jgi:hypothetical protein
MWPRNTIFLSWSGFLFGVGEGYYLLLTRGNPNHWRQLVSVTFFLHLDWSTLLYSVLHSCSINSSWQPHVNSPHNLHCSCHVHIRKTFMWESEDSLSSNVWYIDLSWNFTYYTNPHDFGLELSHLITQSTTTQMVFQDTESNLRCKSYKMSRWKIHSNIAYKSIATYHASLRNCPMSLRIQKNTIVIDLHVYLTNTIVSNPCVSNVTFSLSDHACAPNYITCWS